MILGFSVWAKRMMPSAIRACSFAPDLLSSGAESRSSKSRLIYSCVEMKSGERTHSLAILFGTVDLPSF